MLQSARLLQRLQTHAPFLESLARDVFEIAVGGVAGWNVELGKRLLHLFQLHLAALRDLPGAVQRILHLAEHRQHLIARLEIKLRLRETHALRIAHGLAGLDAQQDFVRARVRLAHVMRVVGGDQRDARFLRKPENLRQDNLVLVQPVILNLQEEIFLAEHVGVAVGQSLGFLVAVRQRSFR